MHILLMTAYFPPEIGSASHIFYDLGQTFIAHGHEVSVVTGFPSYHAQGDLEKYKGKWTYHEDMDGINVYRTVVPQIARDTPIGRGMWQFSCAASFAIAGFRPPRADVALVYSPPLPLGLGALAWRWLRNTPFVFNVQDLFPQSAIDLGILHQKPLIRFFEWLEKYTYRRADAITVHSSGNRDHVITNGGTPETTVVMHNSVDVDSVRPQPKQNDLRTELGLEDKFILSFGGVIGHSQDLDVILEAAQRLSDKEQIHFLLVGDGVEKERLVNKCQAMGLTNVTWMPMQTRERYPRVLHASDVGLATLHADVQTPVVPSKILSIMAGGRPVIAALNLFGDAPKLVADAKAGYCVPPENADELCKVILELYEDQAACDQMGQNGRRYAEQHLSPESVANAYERIFAQVIGESVEVPA